MNPRAASTIRLGTASPATQATTPETLQLLARLATRAASNHVDILLLPEAFLGGYPRGSYFGSVVGSRSTEGREAYARYFQGAVDLGDVVGDGGAGAGDGWVKRQLLVPEGEEYRGDGTREELERIARETGVFLVTGVVEKTGGSLYCSVVYVCPHKGAIGKRRKVMPTGTERLIWAQASPSTLRAVSTVIRGTRINLAAAICWESYMPLLRQSLYNQNINLYLAPTADARDAWLSLMRSIGVEGRCFVVSSNMCVRGDGKGTAVPQEVNGAGAAAAVRDDGRRVSCSDEPTMDIALPKSGSPGRRRQRRKSVFDQDGNEIVLCCPADENGVPTTTMSAGKTTAAAASDSSAAAAVARTTGKTPWVCRGGSCIVDPFGEVLAGPQWEDDEGMIYADVDFQKCIQGRLDLDAGGSYSRNDVFKLTVEGLNMEPLPY